MKNILLLGGTGFVGRALLAELTWDDGLCVTVPTRHRERAKALTVLPTVKVIEADVHDPAILAQLMSSQDAVINLVGVLHSAEGNPYGAEFARAHVELPKKIVAAAHAAGIQRIIHVSALKASLTAPSAYLRSKSAGEQVILESGLAWTIFRPSVIFGAGDAFLTLFARLAKIAPFFPLACPKTRFQPVWVNDVAVSLVASLSHTDSIGKIFDLCGPKIYTLAELVRYASVTAGHPRKIVGLPGWLAWCQAWLMEWFPNPPMTRDNLRSMQVDNICTDCSGLPFGQTATPLDAVAPFYLAPGSQ
jgi:NADH dehydrogenase